MNADSNILKTARKKSLLVNAELHFDTGFSTQLPYDENTFDLVFSSLFFHHLSQTDKLATLKEILRVLKPGKLSSF